MRTHHETNSQVINPFSYDGIIKAPASKSYLQRALVIASMAEGRSILNNVSWANDTRSVCDVVRQLGADVLEYNDRLTIHPGGSTPKDGTVFHVGESGLALRMLSSVAAFYDSNLGLDGSGSLRSRPVKPIVDTLLAAGVQVEVTDDGLPVRFHGPLTAGEIHIDGSFSSQILTGLLICLPLLDHDTILHVHNPTSLPYVDMTLQIMSDFGVAISHEDHRVFHIEGDRKYKGRTYDIEGDWSGAANHLVGAAISGEVTVEGLDPESQQADRAILDVLRDYGAELFIGKSRINVKKNKSVPFEFDATHCPDIFPPLTVLAASCNGTSKIKGTNRLLHKESNRLNALIETFGKLGVPIDAGDDSMIVHGNGRIHGTSIDSFNDHRIAMAAAISAVMSEDPIMIDRAFAIDKSYPGFYADLNAVSAG